MFKAKITDRATQVRFFRFLTVGGVSSAVQFATLWLFNRWATAGVAYTLSYVCSVVTHYLLNRFWAMPSRRSDAGRQLGEYVLTVAVCYLVSFCAFNASHSLFGLSVMWSAACAVPPSTLVGFAILNYRVFGASSGKS